MPGQTSPGHTPSHLNAAGQSAQAAGNRRSRRAFLGGAAVPVYILAWLLIPEDGAAQSIAGELFSSLENRSR